MDHAHRSGGDCKFWTDLKTPSFSLASEFPLCKDENLCNLNSCKMSNVKGEFEL